MDLGPQTHQRLIIGYGFEPSLHPGLVYPTLWRAIEVAKAFSPEDISIYVYYSDDHSRQIRLSELEETNYVIRKKVTKEYVQELIAEAKETFISPTKVDQNFGSTFTGMICSTNCGWYNPSGLFTHPKTLKEPVETIFGISTKELDSNQIRWVLDKLENMPYTWV